MNLLVISTLLVVFSQNPHLIMLYIMSVLVVSISMHCLTNKPYYFMCIVNCSIFTDFTCNIIKPNFICEKACQSHATTTGSQHLRISWSCFASPAGRERKRQSSHFMLKTWTITDSLSDIRQEHHFPAIFMYTYTTFTI